MPQNESLPARVSGLSRSFRRAILVQPNLSLATKIVAARISVTALAATSGNDPVSSPKANHKLFPDMDSRSIRSDTSSAERVRQTRTDWGRYAPVVQRAAT